MGWRYRRNYEFVMVSHRKGGRLAWANQDLAVPNIVRHCPPIERIHPNEKPVDMVSDFIEWHTKPHDLILDPFAGSFTTAVACIQTGRQCIAIEKEPKYFAIGVNRCEEALAIGKDSLFREVVAPDLFAEHKA